MSNRRTDEETPPKQGGHDGLPEEPSTEQETNDSNVWSPRQSDEGSEAHEQD